MFLFLSFLLGELFLFSSGQEVYLCVKPTGKGNCHHHHCINKQCELLQFYFDNVNETINHHDNVTLFFMTGTHNVSLSDSITITTAALKMTGGNQNVTLTESSYSNYTMVFAHVNSTLSIEYIKLVNYGIIGSMNDIDSNAKNVAFKNCSFRGLRSSVPVFRKLLVEHCVFQSVNFNIVDTVKCTNCTFFNSNLNTTALVAGSAPSLTLKDCHVYNSKYVGTDSSTITIRGNSIISSNFAIYYSSIDISGNVTFMNVLDVYGGAMHLYYSNLRIMAGANVTFTNNTALAQGGALYSSSSSLHIAQGANLTFVHNSALDKGGALYIFPGITTSTATADYNIARECFLKRSDYDNSHSIYFADNKAVNEGDDIYGASLLGCSIDSHSAGVSYASSDPLRVCLCESPVKPLCSGMDVLDSDTYNYVNLSRKVYPGESFTVPILLVGVDYGTTTGVVYTKILGSENSSNVKLDTNPESARVISNHKECTGLNYSFSTNHTLESVITLYISPINLDNQLLRNDELKRSGYCPDDNYCYGPKFMPVFFNVTILPCPPGFSLNEHCDCYLHNVVFDNCTFVNGTGYFSWSSKTWASIYNGGVLYNTYCPFDYCNVTGMPVNLLNESDSQCAFNRAGRLCGGCRENYSLAIGSSHCIQCHNNNNLALVIFFTAAGFILVFFITALNLTVSQGMINGLIFYANIVWMYQSVFFSPHQERSSLLSFFKVFIAWVNLDFGIETCFISGLTAFWKTWLQFFFPFYLWAIAGLIIVASRYSTKLTRLLGNRAVPVLGTLFLLSYTKLLRLAVMTLAFSRIKYTDQNTSTMHTVVWSVDGNLSYFGYPHFLLFLAGLAILVVLCLPYTILLFSMQLLRRLPRSRLTNWIMKFHPVYDAYFAPLKVKHQYWFGVLLLARVILLLMFVLSFAIPQYVNLLILLIVGGMLTFYVAIVQPYKSTAILLLESVSFINLNFLAGFVTASSLSNQPILQACAVGLSTGVTFVQFCGIVLYALSSIVKSRFKGTSNCFGFMHTKEQELSTDFHDSVARYPVMLVANEALPLVSSVRNV